MVTGLADSVQVPSWAWQRDEAREALRTRNVAALFRFVQAYTGASQARLAAATGTSQGRVNEIINGRRVVTALDVYERIADGLGMPDDARALLGLAPTDAGRQSARATYAEIARIFAGQQAAAGEIGAVAAHATRIDVLAVRALGLMALNDSLLRPAFAGGPRKGKIFLLDPDCAAARMRAAEVGETATSFTDGIRLSLRRLAELAGQPGLDLAVYVYDTQPVWRVIALDDTLYVSGFAAWEGHSSTMYKLLPTDGGALHQGFRRMLDDLAGRSRQVI